MRILLGCESLRPPLTGIGNYTLELLRQLQSHPSVEAVSCALGGRFYAPEKFLSETSGASKGSADKPSGTVVGEGLSYRMRVFLRQLPFTYSARSWLTSRRFVAGAEKLGGFIYHEPNYILNPFSGASIATVHDLSVPLYPEFHPIERVKFFMQNFERTLASANALIVDSDVVGQQLIADWSVDPLKVHAVHLAAGEQFSPRTENECMPVLCEFGLEYRAYFLFVGTLEPRKNLERLLDAYEALPQRVRVRFPLVIAGGSGWRNESLLARIERMSRSGSVRYLRFVSADQLPLLYAAAAAFVYPSLYEGFGLPVLEAMASGTAVICSSNTSMSEFAGAAALTCHPEDSQSLSELMVRLVEDETYRLSREKLALSRAGDFSWRRCAEETIRVYALANQMHEG